MADNYSEKNEKNEINEIFQSLSRGLDMPPEEIESSYRAGDANNLMRNLNGEQAKQVESVLSDPDKTRELLESPEAQALLKLLNGQ